MRWTVLALVATAIGLLGVDACFHDLFPLAGVPVIGNPDTRCAALSGTHPASFAFVPDGGRIWVADRAISTMVPFDVGAVPPMLPTLAPKPFSLPEDTDFNGEDDVPAPVLQEIQIFGAEELLPGLQQAFGLLTAAAYDEVLFFDPNFGGLITNLMSIQVPGDGFAKSDNPELPEPGVEPELRSGLSTRTCVRSPKGAFDSFGLEFMSLSPCGEEINSFYSIRTTGAAVVAYSTTTPGGDPITEHRLFVSMANPGRIGFGGEDPQFLPGTVLVYDVSNDAVVSPEDSGSFVRFTEGYNPTHVTPYHVGDRSFVLVTVSGAVGIVKDDSATPNVKEGGFVARTDAAIEVFDAETLALVAIIPLGRAGLTGGLAIDPSGRIAVMGSLVGRWLLAVDLEPLATLELTRDDLPVTLDGSNNEPNAVLYDANAPFVIDPRSTSPAGPSCPGISAGVAFNDAGDLVYATDFCDGTLAVVSVNLGGTPTFTMRELIVLSAPFDTTDTESPRAPAAVTVRPGPPGSSLDVFVLVGLPEGLLCAIDVESTPASP